MHNEIIAEIAIIIAIFANRIQKCYNSSNSEDKWMEEYLWETPSDIDRDIAKRIKSIRKRRKITQKQLAGRSNVSYASLKKFEQTGEISLISLTKIAMELGLAGELKSLFTQPVYLSIEEVVNDKG